MTPNPSPFQQFFGEIAWVLLAMVGGLARYLDGYIRQGQGFKVGLAITHAMVSGFSGYMVAQVALKVQPDWALIAAGVGGYLGTQGLDFISRVVQKRLAPDVNPAEPKKPGGNDVQQ